jgi:glyoxylase-like metal-dependent hydrolase (beta-lactamase superfamily II)
MSVAWPLVEALPVARWKVHAIQAGGIKLDGGAMFGIVPKPLWERRIPADERNRIQLGMRCLVIEHEVGPVLVDTGLGNKEDAKFHDIYGVENGGRGGRTRLEDGLLELGLRPEDVALVILTHLHFDHAGGSTYSEGGVVRPTFPRARYVVQRGEFEFASRPNERTAASYLPHNFQPLVEAGMLQFVDGDVEIAAGVTLVRTPGHTPWHQSVLLDAGNERVFFPADLFPTAAHVPLPWIMGYDVEPLVTLETKRRILHQAKVENWLVVFEHDSKVSSGRIVHDGKGFAAVHGEREKSA